ncbi:glycosyltransferase family 2 protein [Maritimibacter dapengensis]|uniref:Glycosyltransferase family 2 protein n=1 Tax=Maritimibacter dapengensis TaxID=2836868 RepID=A0ABS6T3L5_9RHOB|nr:glycosyltransferase family 2 protein [Maritimibacter dapengensis]MBV7379837.1 glycosyltransferase family 2 protein [Maritimibacter dapengensis]
MPHASIVVPAFNVEATLADTMVSLLKQSFLDLEIIVVDDGSYDRTPEIADGFCADPRVRVVRQSNRGLAGARNTGIAAAQGQIIGFCDSDDLWHPEKLSAHVHHLQMNPSLGMSYSGSELIDDDGTSLGLFQKPRTRRITAKHMFLRNPVGNGSSPVFRRTALDDLAYRPSRETMRDWVFDETFSQSEDIECWMRLMLTTDWEVEGIDDPLTLYRVNGAGLSAGTERQLASWERMVEKHAGIAPVFIAKHASPARAYQLRYLARRAVSARDGDRARALITRSFRASLHPLVHEPAKTIATLVACILVGTPGAVLVDAAQSTLRRLRRA